MTVRRYAAEPSSSSEVRAFLHQELGRKSLPATTLFDLLLAVSEAANNAIEHGGPQDNGSFEVTLSIEPESEPEWIYIEVADVGHFATDVSQPELGFGFSMMESVMDEVELRRDGSRTSVRLSKRVHHH